MSEPTTLEEPWWRRAGRQLRRGGIHLVRPRGQWAFAFAVIAGLLAWRVGVSSNVGQISIVVLGICISVWLLPEEPHRLWNVTDRDLADLVPPAKLRDTLRTVATAVDLQEGSAADADDLDHMWQQAIADLDAARRDASRIVRDVTYSIRISPRSDEPPWVKTTIAATRCVPGAGESVWFSFCSNQEALDEEFMRHGEGCIGREIVDLRPSEEGDLDKWQERVETYEVLFDLDNERKKPLRTYAWPDAPEERDWRVVRVEFPAGQIARRPVPTMLTMEFEADPGQRRYPVKFSAYWVLGPTQVTFEVLSPEAVVDKDEYFSAATRPLEIHYDEGRSGKGYSIRASENTVLPPGSGAVFTWLNAPRVDQIGDAGALLVDTYPPIDELPEGQALPASVVVPSERPRCLDVGEALVPVVDPAKSDRLVERDAYASLGILPERPLLARQGVVDRLRQAAEAFPPGFGLVVLDAHRTVGEQRALGEFYDRDGSMAEYVAPVRDDAIRPPHTTGGTVDLTLSWQGEALALGTDFDSFSPDAHFDAFETEDSVVRRLRRLLAEVMVDAGFAPYRYEWWHWSYGDDVWAATYDTKPLYDIVDRPEPVNDGDPQVDG